MHDTLLFYSKTENLGTFNVLMQPTTESSIKRWKGNKQKVTFDRNGIRQPTLEVDNEVSEVAMNAVWNIPIIAPISKERLGYPTQKPLALLERVMLASSNERDLVLDPFSGSGTSIHAAEKHNRRWIGIDSTHFAIALLERRVHKSLPGIKYDLYGVPKDLESARALAAFNKVEFARWAVSLIPDAQPYKTEGGVETDIEGVLYLKLGKNESIKGIILIECGTKINVGMVRGLKRTIERENGTFGLILSLAEPTKLAGAEAAEVRSFEYEGKQYPRIQILTIEELLEFRRLRTPLVFKKRICEEADHQGSPDV